MSVDDNKNRTICFSGHSTEKLPKSNKEFTNLILKLHLEIEKAITEGYSTFIFGACFGFDLICAEQILMRKQIIRFTDPIGSIKLVAVVPFESQAAKWNVQDRDKYFNILSKCDDVITSNKHYNNGCYHERNRYIVDKSSKLICYYDGSCGGTKYTVEYAEKQSLQIINLCTNFSNL